MTKSAVVSGILALLASRSIVSASPPPPTPPGYPDFPKLLTESWNSEDLDRYDKMFASDLKLYDNGGYVGAGHAVLRSYVGKLFSLHQRVRPFIATQGGNQLLVLDDVVNDVPEPTNGVRDCCPWSRAVLYVFDEKLKISEVHFLHATQAAGVHVYPPLERFMTRLGD